ncbi:phage integrase [Novosphingobium sp. Rr 2-17]|nr:phage integrase [Novosphingobium sp. Rr 2-17]
MTYSHLDPAMQNRVAWNAGQTVGTKQPLTQKQIWAIRSSLIAKSGCCWPES